MAQHSEWNAAAYHRVANPHVHWGSELLNSITLNGDEVVLDAGCGTGRVTRQLLERLPLGRVIAVDRSSNMLEQAALELPPQFADQVRFVQADLQTIAPDEIGEQFDLVFSTATFHWIKDHPRLFGNLLQLLTPGGLLVAQCGGGENIAQLLSRAGEILSREPFAESFSGWSGPWEFADANTTIARLRAAGFTDVSAQVFAAPTTLGSADEYHEFLSTVIFGEHRLRLPTEGMKTQFIDQMTAMASTDASPFHLDYWRLNMQGRRPA